MFAVGDTDIDDIFGDKQERVTFTPDARLRNKPLTGVFAVEEHVFFKFFYPLLFAVNLSL